MVGVIGDPVSHSLSPLLHNAAFDALGLDWVSVGFGVPMGAVPDALEGMRAFGIAGLSVTMPHKQAAHDAVDERSAVAARLGAVNCVTLRGDRLVGDSTDGEGFLAALARGIGFDPRGRRCVVIGAGGAARAIVVALADAGAAEVAVVNRTRSHGKAASRLAGPAGRVGHPADVGDADLVVQATPIGLAGEGEGAAVNGTEEYDQLIDLGRLHRDQVVVDLVYRPSRTRLLEAAAARGAVTANGLGMLVHQAALALERWTGRDAPLEAMWAAVRPFGADGTTGQTGD